MSEEVESDVEGEAAASLALNPKAERDLCSLFAGSFVGFLLGIVTDYAAVVDFSAPTLSLCCDTAANWIVGTLLKIAIRCPLLRLCPTR